MLGTVLIVILVLALIGALGPHSREMVPNGAGAIGKARYVRAWGESGEMGVLLNR
ncbi:MAG: hypothetical protein WCF22_00295 [Candidatus Sulfotelmatobacter sp.]